MEIIELEKKLKTVSYLLLFTLLVLTWLIFKVADSPVGRYQISAGGAYVIDTKTGEYKEAGRQRSGLTFDEIKIEEYLKTNKYHRNKGN